MRSVDVCGYINPARDPHQPRSPHSPSGNATRMLNKWLANLLHKTWDYSNSPLHLPLRLVWRTYFKNNRTWILCQNKGEWMNRSLVWNNKPYWQVVLKVLQLSFSVAAWYASDVEFVISSYSMCYCIDSHFSNHVWVLTNGRTRHCW